MYYTSVTICYTRTAHWKQQLIYGICSHVELPCRTNRLGPMLRYLLDCCRILTQVRTQLGCWLQVINSDIQQSTVNVTHYTLDERGKQINVCSYSMFKLLYPPSPRQHSHTVWTDFTTVLQVYIDDNMIMMSQWNNGQINNTTQNITVNDNDVHATLWVLLLVRHHAVQTTHTLLSGQLNWELLSGYQLEYTHTSHTNTAHQLDCMHDTCPGIGEKYHENSVLDVTYRLIIIIIIINEFV